MADIKSTLSSFNSDTLNFFIPSTILLTFYLIPLHSPFPIFSSVTFRLSKTKNDVRFYDILRVSNSSKLYFLFLKGPAKNPVTITGEFNNYSMNLLISSSFFDQLMISLK